MDKILAHSSPIIGTLLNSVSSLLFPTYKDDTYVAIVGAPKADTHGKIFTCDFKGKQRYPNPISCIKKEGNISMISEF